MKQTETAPKKKNIKKLEEKLNNAIRNEYEDE